MAAARQMIASLGASDFVGIYTLEESLIELAPFTRDVAVLTAALDAVASTPSIHDGRVGRCRWPVPRCDSTGAGGAEAAAMRGRMEAGLDELERHYAAGLQGAAFSGLIAGLSQFPGRRAVFMYSGGLATPDVLPKLEGVVGVCPPAARQLLLHPRERAGRTGTRKRPGPATLRPRRAHELERRDARAPGRRSSRSIGPAASDRSPT